MQESVQVKSHTILLTDVGSYLGASLAAAFLAQGSSIYGCGKTNPPEQILANNKFTFVDINLSQPLPHHLPSFDLIIHLSSQKIEEGHELSSAAKNILELAKDEETQVALCLPIASNIDFLDTISHSKEEMKKLKVFLVGEIYGPLITLGGSDKKSYYSQNRLTDLIEQAVQKDKIILTNEGVEILYPTYIEDASHAIRKIINQADAKVVKFIVSQDPLTELSASYDIQNAARSALEKDLGIFFLGAENPQPPAVAPIVKIGDLGFSPKFDLQAGLKETFLNLKSRGLVHAQHTFKPEPTEPTVPKFEMPKKSDQQPLVAKHLQLKKPSLKLTSGKKRFALALVIFLIIVTAKLFLDTYLGLQNLQKSKNLLTSGDFAAAQTKASNAHKNLSSAHKEISFLTYPFSFVLSHKVGGLTDALMSAKITASALENFSIGAESLSKNLAFIAGQSSNQERPSREDAVAAFSKAHFDASLAKELAASANDANILKSKISKATVDLALLANTSQISAELSDLLPTLTGVEGQKNYLVLIVNNMELRPGGGFIGNYATINFTDGKLGSVNVEDIYAIDGQLKEKIDPPPQLNQKLGVKQLFLRDSNWTTDFGVNAKTARDFYKKETGQEVDGVIAFDLTFMQKLLEKIGPIHLDDYNEDITAENLFEKGEYYAEIGFFPGSTQKKDFFASLSRTLIERITSSISAPGKEHSVTPLLALVGATKDGLAGKNLLLSVDDQTASAFIRSKAWDNALPPISFDPSDDSTSARDILAISEANIGANKANRYLERKVDYEMTIGRDADLHAKTTIHYKNNSPGNSWPAGTYVNYLRVYAPENAGLEDFQVDGESIIQNIDVGSQANLTVFGTILEVPIKAEKTVVLTYRIPKNIKLETAPSYSVYFQKQPGTLDDALTFSFNLPAFLKINSVNSVSETGAKQSYQKSSDLSQDRQFTIEVSRK